MDYYEIGTYVQTPSSLEGFCKKGVVVDTDKLTASVKILYYKDSTTNGMWKVGNSQETIKIMNLYYWDYTPDDKNLSLDSEDKIFIHDRGLDE